eukprot:TRINITY_DN3633_c0_g1_i2.p1 TRINITY_DN3633_c0_g1~~TRINITY_DN3633_c0_g1_i2.p1  ORF type:complete len:280 (+),score=44.11 TRINITY_DN3633_c0_g1_i2:178-1017(+)
MEAEEDNFDLNEVYHLMESFSRDYNQSQIYSNTNHPQNSQHIPDILDHTHNSNLIYTNSNSNPLPFNSNFNSNHCPSITPDASNHNQNLQHFSITQSYNLAHNQFQTNEYQSLPQNAFITNSSVPLIRQQHVHPSPRYTPPGHLQQSQLPQFQISSIQTPSIQSIANPSSQLHSQISYQAALTPPFPTQQQPSNPQQSVQQNLLQQFLPTHSSSFQSSSTQLFPSQTPLTDSSSTQSSVPHPNQPPVLPQATAQQYVRSNLSNKMYPVQPEPPVRRYDL